MHESKPDRHSVPVLAEAVEVSDLELGLMRENTRLRAANKELQCVVRGAYGMAAAMLEKEHILGQINESDVIHRQVVIQAVAEWRALIKALAPKPLSLVLDGAKNIVPINSLAEVGVPVIEYKGDPA